jgi:hypothetical protein
MRKIQFETRTHQGRSKKSLLFIAPQLNSGSSNIRDTLVEFENYGTFYIPHYVNTWVFLYSLFSFYHVYVCTLLIKVANDNIAMLQVPKT